LTLKQHGLLERGERLGVLIKHMASSYAKGRVSKTEIDDLKEDIGDNRWIPVAPNEFVSTRHAVLSSEFDDIGSFRKVPRSLS